MKIDLYASRLQNMNNLIRRKATGNPEKFAEKIGISKSNLTLYLDYIRAKGIQVIYDKERQSYCYEMDGEVHYQCGFTVIKS